MRGTLWKKMEQNNPLPWPQHEAHHFYAAFAMLGKALKAQTSSHVHMKEDLLCFACRTEVQNLQVFKEICNEKNTYNPFLPFRHDLASEASYR